MSLLVTFTYDQNESKMYRNFTDGSPRLCSSETAKCKWEMEGATHVGDCEVTETVTIWLAVENGVITGARSLVTSVEGFANALCGKVRGMTVDDVRKMLDNQPAGQPAQKSVVAEALAAALAGEIP